MLEQLQHPSALVGLIVKQHFRRFLRVPQAKSTTGKALQDLHTGKIIVLTGDVGAGKSTFAGEIFDELRGTKTVPIYINGDDLRHRGVGETLSTACSRRVAKQLSKVVSKKGAYTEDFLDFLVSHSEYFVGLNAVRRQSPEIVHTTEYRTLLAKEIQSWRSGAITDVIDDLGAYLACRFKKFAILLDNWDGFSFGDLRDMSTALAGVRIAMKRETSLMFFVRPTAEATVLSAVQFGEHAVRLRIEAMATDVLSRRVEFPRTTVFADAWATHCSSIGAEKSWSSDSLTNFAANLASGLADLADLCSHTNTPTIEYVELKNFRIVQRPAVDVIAEWHNNNIREVATSMRSYRGRFAGFPDRSTAVLRHVLTYGSANGDLLHEDLQLLVPDVDIFHGGLIHLRWRILQYLARQTSNDGFSALEIAHAFNHFETNPRPVANALKNLVRRKGLETGLVGCDQADEGEKFHILPAGRWFVSGLCHTVEYMFLLAKADQRHKAGILGETDQEKAFCAASYVANQLLVDFGLEHPYIRPDYSPDDVTQTDKANLREFCALFGYGTHRGWFLTRFLFTLESFMKRKGVDKNLSPIPENLRTINDAIARLDTLARVVGLQEVGLQKDE